MDNEKIKTGTKILSVEVPNTCQTVEALDVLQSVECATANTLKLMTGRYGGGFYINYLQDEGSKTGHLNMVIVYPDNQYKRIFLAKNLFKIVDTDSDGIEKVERLSTTYVPKRHDSMEYGDFRILEKYETPKMPIPSKALWKMVIDNYEKIPVVPVYKTESISGIYWRLFDIASAESNNNGCSSRVNDVRFLVTKQEMEQAASENGLTLSQLRTELNLLGLLIKDKPHTRDGKMVVNSYQLTKKVEGRNVRFYALKIKIDKPVCEVDSSVCVEYSEELSKTEVEKRLEEEQAINVSLKAQLEAKEKEIRDLYQNRIDDTTTEEIMKHLV